MTIYTRGYCDRVISDDPPGTPISFVISTSGIKGDGLDLNPADFNFDRFLKNPVVLWAHDFFGSHPPIGRITNIQVEPDRLIAPVIFDSKDEFAANIERKYRDGFLSAVSISWDTTRTGETVSHELLEVSGVPVPMDPDALIQRQQTGLQRIARLIDATLTPVPPTFNPVFEGVWRGIADSMIALFQSTPEKGDFKGVYDAISGVYRALGKTSPEFVAVDTLTAMTASQVRGLFLEDEFSLSPDGLGDVLSPEQDMLNTAYTDELEAIRASLQEFEI